VAAVQHTAEPAHPIPANEQRSCIQQAAATKALHRCMECSNKDHAQHARVCNRFLCFGSTVRNHMKSSRSAELHTNTNNTIGLARLPDGYQRMGVVHRGPRHKHNERARTLRKPIATARSRKQRRHIMRPYLRMIPRWLAQTRLHSKLRQARNAVSAGCYSNRKSDSKAHQRRPPLALSLL
jgi:hypothetical protein